MEPGHCTRAFTTGEGYLKRLIAKLKPVKAELGFVTILFAISLGCSVFCYLCWRHPDLLMIEEGSQLQLWLQAGLLTSAALFALFTLSGSFLLRKAGEKGFDEQIQSLRGDDMADGVASLEASNSAADFVPMLGQHLRAR